MSGAESCKIETQSSRIYFWKIHVGLWEKSCSFVGKIMSVCGIIPVSLWEKFGEQSILLDNSRQFVGKIQWTKVQCWIIPVSLWEKITGLFTSICRGTASHNVYLTENSPKLKTIPRTHHGGTKDSPWRYKGLTMAVLRTHHGGTKDSPWRYWGRTWRYQGNTMSPWAMTKA